jgi:hypothetical protein
MESKSRDCPTEGWACLGGAADAVGFGTLAGRAQDSRIPTVLEFGAAD